MGKTGKWIRNLLTGKKDKVKDNLSTSNHQSISYAHDQNPTTPIAILPSTPKEKRRWSFRRSSAAGTGQKEDTLSTTAPASLTLFESENEQKKHAVAVAVATAAAADAAVAAARAAATMMRLTATAGRVNPVEDTAATKIQSVFRSYLARKALSALKGLVKLQALVRGHLVRKQATATLRCMQALVTVQARARAQRIGISGDMNPYNHRQMIMRTSTQDNRYRNIHQDQMEENIKIVEMDIGQSKGSTKSRNSYSSNTQTDYHRFSTYTKNVSDQPQISPSPSAITDLSPQASSGHFEDFSFGTTQSSPQYYSAMSKPNPSKTPFANYPRAEYAESLSSYEYTLFPNYMANTQSSRAKVRSHSAPKQRTVETFERQPSINKRRPSIEGRNVPRGGRYQRSISQVGSAAQNYQYPWSVVKLDKSMVSIVDSECGSTSTVMTNPNYCRSLVGFDIFIDISNCRFKGIDTNNSQPPIYILVVYMTISAVSVEFVLICAVFVK